MLTPQKKNTTIGPCRIIELAGKDDDRLLYLALHRDIRKPYWLLESTRSLGEVQVGDEHAERFNVRDKEYIAFPVPGSSVATIAKLTSELSWKFTTSRWVGLSKDIGYFHSKGQVYQERHSLNFESLVFNDASQIIPLSYARSIPNTFPAPETKVGSFSPASDVYTLAASLLALLGASSPDQLIAKRRLSAEHGLGQVLQRAMDMDPAKRHKDGNEFARALVEILPDLEDDPSAAKRNVKDKKGFNITPLAPFLGLILFLLIFACGGLLYYGVPQSYLFPSPTIQVVAPSPTVALLAGSLDFDLSPFTFSPACQASADVIVRKGGQPIPNGAAPNFETLVTGNLVLTTWTKSAPVGQYHIDFPSAPICTNGGTIRLTAKLQNDSVSKSLYFDPNRTSAQKFSFSTIQIDAQAYPQIVVYFSLAAPDGSAVRLSGSSQVQIKQDSAPVTNFVMTFLDPTTVPATVALVLDVSGSMSGKPLTDARQAAADFVNRLGERDASCIYSFSTRVTKVQNCTSDRRAAVNSLNTLVASGNTSLYDVITAVAADHAKLTGRQAIIVLSDGADTASKSNLNDSLNRIKQTNIPVYAVGMVSRDYKGDVLKQLASSTGGSYLEAPSSSDLRGLYTSIQGQIKTQYRVVFTSLFPDRKTGTVSIQILTGGQTIETSRTYFVK
jgi:VWFA-related protein